MSNHLFFEPTTLSIFYKLAVAMFCGVLMGTERVISHKSAGTRTYALVSMGAALFVLIGNIVVGRFVGGAGFDPVHIMASIISGIGFMGAGVIIFRDSSVTGLTTASGLWVAAGVGIASGFGLYNIAILATLLALFIFVVLWYLENAIKKLSKRWDHDGQA